MKTYFTAFIVAMAILSLVHDSQEFTAGAGTTVGRRSFEKVERLNEIKNYIIKILKEI